MKTHLEDLATALGRPADQLQELDYQPLALAFTPGSFVTYVVRDRASSQILEVTLDLETGEPVDPAALRELDREQGAAAAKRLSPDLLSLVLRHASLDAISVTVRCSPDALQGGSSHGGELEQQLQAQLNATLEQSASRRALQTPDRDLEATLTLSARQIVSLATSQLVQSIELAVEPEIPDRDG